jgi:membrane protein DedA with SNARE-associated domain
MLVVGGIGLPPIPEELPVIGAGIWVAGNPELGPLRWIALPVCIAGILISDVLLYGIGRLWGTRLLKHRWLARLLPEDKRKQTQRNFQRYGVSILLMVRWLPGIRSPMFITAGTMKLPLIRFIVADAIAASIGHSLLFFLAFWFGDQFRELVIHLEREVDYWIRPLLVLAAVGLVAGYLLYHFYQRPISTGDPHELPLIGDRVAAQIESTTPEDSAPPAAEFSANGADGQQTSPTTPPATDAARPGSPE